MSDRIGYLIVVVLTILALVLWTVDVVQLLEVLSR